MEPIRTQAAPVNGVANVSASGQTGQVTQSGSAGSNTFTQTLVHAMQDGTGTTTSQSLSVMLLPGLLVGGEVESQQQTEDPASALLQLLTQMLNGEQAVKPSTESETITDESLDFSSALAQLQLLLLQLLSSQGNDSANSDRTSVNQGSFAELSSKLGDSAKELLQLIASINQEQVKPSEMKTSILNLMEMLKPVLVQAAAGIQYKQAEQMELASSSNVQQASSYLLGGDAYRSMLRKPLKEQSSSTVTAPQPLIHIMSDARGLSGLNVLAAKAVLQAPVTQDSVEAVAAGRHANPEVPLELGAHSGQAEEASDQAIFRLGAAPENVAKGDAPVISANRFAQEMSQLLKSMNLQSAGGQQSSIRITLMPEHLGQVDVRMSMQNGQLVAQFVADSLHGKDMLESQLPQLRAALQAQGLQVERLEVTQSQQSAFAMFQDSRQQQSSRQFNRNGQENGNQGEDLPIDFDAELAELAARKAALAGSSFDVSA